LQLIANADHVGYDINDNDDDATDDDVRMMMWLERDDEMLMESS
jgi:hypothetical protein